MRLRGKGIENERGRGKRSENRRVRGVRIKGKWGRRRGKGTGRERAKDNGEDICLL